MFTTHLAHLTPSKTFEYFLSSNHENKENILFLNGFRMKMNSWDTIFPDIETLGNVLLYNRLGVGASSKAQEDQDGKRVVEDLRDLVQHLQLNPPYVLVAHSLGGIFANLFARMCPDEIKAVIFVESSNPLEIIEQKKFKPPVILDLLNSALQKIEKTFDPYTFSEDEVIEQSLFQIEQAPSFPNIHLSVISGMQKMPFVPKKSFEIHVKYQYRLLDLSKHSRHYLAHKSGHFPQITEPEIIVDAIRDRVRG
jgi:pimeloyl-ACP methyl ester carboxylesterase